MTERTVAVNYIARVEGEGALRIRVDFELRGCPINKRQLLEVVSAFLTDRAPQLPSESVCEECKRRGTVCVVVARGIPCLGRVTQAGCGAICPSYARGCYGCFGPQDTPNAASLVRRIRDLGLSSAEVTRVFRTFNAGAPAFREASVAAEGGEAAAR